jgi:hypothetical protein
LLISYATWTLAAAGIGICITTFVLVGDLRSTVMICACAYTTMLGLMGYSASVLGLQFTTSYVTSLIMSVGFSVDYCAHVVIAYRSAGIADSAHSTRNSNKLEVGDAPPSQQPSDCATASTTRSKLSYTFQVYGRNCADERERLT